MLLIKNPISQFFTHDGDPLDNGSVYFGVAGSNPEASPISIYWDRDGLIPAENPVKTSRGWISNNGTPARLFINDTDYSINVRDKNGVLIYSALSVTGETIGALSGTNGAGEIGYDNSVSSLTATNVQDAIDEVAASPKVDRAGDTMTGPLSVPAGAIGTQVPQAQEVVQKAGGAARIPTWTTAGRPSSPSAGDTGFNTTLGANETWNGSAWVPEGWVKSSLISLSGTAVDVTGIPSWVNELAIIGSSVSTNGSDIPVIRLGTSGGVVASGYLGSSGYGGTSGGGFGSSDGFGVGTLAPADVRHFDLRLKHMGGNLWQSSVIGAVSSSANFIVGGGSVQLSGVLDRIRFTTFGGVNVFDSGSIIVMWRA